MLYVTTPINKVILNSLQLKNIDPQNERVNSMIMYSGGADSLSLAKSVLETTNHNVVIHHVVINNFEKRGQFQLDVIDGQLDYLRKNCRQFKFIKTTFEMELNNKHVGSSDVSVSLFMAGAACRALGKYFSIIYTGHMSGTRMTDFIEASSILNSLFTNNRFKPVWLYPMRSLGQSLEKREIYKNIGKEGLAMTVSCRKPIVTGNQFTSCLKCHACKTREKTVKELGWDPSLVK